MIKQGIILCLCLAGVALGQQCPQTITPDPDFNMDDWQGKWYEIAKIQTQGGAAFQEGCICVEMEITPLGESTDADIVFTCRNYTVDGAIRRAPGRLVNMEDQGRWEVKYYPGDSGLSFTVSIQGEEFTMTYDCRGEEYCVHMASRTRTMDPRILEELAAIANELGMNPQNLPIEMIQQEGCPNPGP